MKKQLLVLPVVIGMAASANAGEAPAMPSSKYVTPPPAECRLQWFLAGSAGYLTDAEEGMYHLQLGVEKICQQKCCSHALYLEVGYTNIDDSFQLDLNDSTFDINFDTDIIPLTLNYKYECYLTGKLNWYVGAGAGIAFVDTDISIAENGDPVESGSVDDEVFYAQIFTGLVYNYSDSFEVFGGARYIFMDDPDYAGSAIFDNHASIDGDVLLELGARFNF